MLALGTNSLAPALRPLEAEFGLTEAIVGAGLWVLLRIAVGLTVAVLVGWTCLVGWMWVTGLVLG